jgi:hypothetical protein
MEESDCLIFMVAQDHGFAIAHAVTVGDASLAVEARFQKMAATPRRFIPPSFAMPLILLPRFPHTQAGITFA